MTPDLDLTRCLACQRTYRAGSKPCWAFWSDGRIAGSIHAVGDRCSARWLDLGGLQTWRLDAAYYSAEMAQFHAWRHSLMEQPERDSDVWHAQFLADGDTLSETLTESQEERLAWWHDGPLKRSDERIAGIRATYQQLIRDFRAWQSVIEKEPKP